MYSVVVFTNTNDVDVVASKWVMKEFDEMVCYWPSSAKPSVLAKAVRVCKTPVKDSWHTFPCRVLYQTGQYYFAVFFSEFHYY